MDLSQLMASMGPIQEAMKQQEEERAQTILEGRSGGGAVSIRLRGDLSVAGIAITPTAVSSDADDVTMLEDLIHTALSDALKQYRDRFGANAEEQMQKTLAGSDMASLLGGLMGGR
ncbi:MAG: YbaB/EbfC family nucleoid-associated protein [Planctomycetota bacterium]|nr:MAG: YbaB/EbfC family nucleoid-associated protein [Planctomycetota bacterium]